MLIRAGPLPRARPPPIRVAAPARMPLKASTAAQPAARAAAASLAQPAPALAATRHDPPKGHQTMPPLMTHQNPVISSNARSSRFAGPDSGFRGEIAADAAGAMSAMHQDANDYVCSLFDPFNHPGARIPDLLSIGSATVQSTRRITIKSIAGTDPSGAAIQCAYFGLRPCSTNCQYSASTCVLGTYGGFTFANDPMQGSLAANAFAERVASMGIRVSNITAQLNRGGQIMFARTPGGAPGLTLASYQVSPYATFMDAADQDLVSKVLTFRPVDYDTSLAYFIPTTVVSDGELVVIIESTVAFSIEVDFTTNYQVLPLPTVSNLFVLGVSAAGPSESNQAMMVADAQLGAKAAVAASTPATGHESNIAADIARAAVGVGRGLLRKVPLVGGLIDSLLGNALWMDHLVHIGTAAPGPSKYARYLATMSSFRLLNLDFAPLTPEELARFLPAPAPAAAVAPVAAADPAPAVSVERDYVNSVPNTIFRRAPAAAGLSHRRRPPPAAPARRR